MSQSIALVGTTARKAPSRPWPTLRLRRYASVLALLLIWESLSRLGVISPPTCWSRSPVSPPAS
jgi:ABC-type nitrate/sulfonate/bicarbonate transport system permease component